VDAFSNSAIRAGLFDGGHLGLELGQGLGHGFQLGLEPRLGQILLRAKRLAGPGDHLIGHRLRRLRGLGSQQFGVGALVVFTRPQPLLGQRKRRAGLAQGQEGVGGQGQ
jgi:hypothetical protein